MSQSQEIKGLREQLGWTQKRLAEYLGIDRSSLARIEAGVRPLPRTCQRTLGHLTTLANANAARKSKAARREQA